jgi:hypothetical protein
MSGERSPTLRLTTAKTQPIPLCCSRLSDRPQAGSYADLPRCDPGARLRATHRLCISGWSPQHARDAAAHLWGYLRVRALFAALFSCR